MKSPILLFTFAILCLAGCADDGSLESSDKLSEEELDIVFVHPSPPEIVAFAEERATKIEIEVDRLGSNIYGLEIQQGRETSEGLRYLSATHDHDFWCSTPEELVDARWGEIIGAYRRFWSEKPGWEDQVFSRIINSEPGVPADAAKLPAKEDWRRGTLEAKIRVLLPDTADGIAEGERRLRKFAATYFEHAAQMGNRDNVRIALYLDLFEPSKFAHTKPLPQG